MRSIVEFPTYCLLMWLKQLYIKGIDDNYFEPPLECHYGLLDGIIPKTMWMCNCQMVLGKKYDQLIWEISQIFNVLFWYVVYKLSCRIGRRWMRKENVNSDEKILEDGDHDRSVTLPLPDRSVSLSDIGEDVHSIMTSSSLISSDSDIGKKLSSLYSSNLQDESCIIEALNSASESTDKTGSCEWIERTDHRSLSDISLSSSTTMEILMNYGQVIPVEINWNLTTSFSIANQFIERCHCNYVKNKRENAEIHVHEKWIDLGPTPDLLVNIKPIILERNSFVEENGTTWKNELSSIQHLDKSEGDQKNNLDLQYFWEGDEKLSQLSVENSFKDFETSDTYFKPLTPPSMKNLIEEVNYSLTSDDPLLIESYMNGRQDNIDDPRGFLIRREYQENTLSCKTSTGSVQSNNDSFSRFLRDLPLLEEAQKFQPFTSSNFTQIRDRKPTTLCGCKLDRSITHCVIPARCSHMFCFNCAQENLKLPTTEVHHEIMEELSLNEKKLILEYEELLEFHSYQSIISPEDILIPWNVTTYQIPGTEMLFGCNFETDQPKPCPTCGVLSEKYWEVIPPPIQE
ncbi:hypothetical protein SNEBB_004903 [Seison nebaliae]|nr:hypothetical protein SNEBB_004903 [Seison nebaliae]